ncbi:TIGR04141 family sporadically distributed protein [Snodgrassella gandavensis]|uniref:TIGR04141 family sporadically distributed protein n=1 Tax=Snodgrassella gandavensis TaxID=2946698 RepID=UPI001EF73584|nr:TIGR04141 family sporadically distributed protein [Snodgrassella gandavensis]
MMKDNIKSVKEIITESEKIHNKKIKLGSDIGYLYYKSNQLKSPKWISLFEQFIDDTLEEVKNSSSSAVFIIKASKRFFALTFGYGKSLLQNDCYEENFGLRVALNSIDAEKLRSIDREHLDSIPRQERSQTNKATALPNFGIDIEQDLIKAVTGTPTDTTLGKRLYGKDILKLNIPFSLEKIIPLLKKLENLYQATTYKENFAWIDNLKEVRENSLISELNNQLLHKIQTDNFDKTWLVIPEIIDWSDIGGFRYQEKVHGKKLEDIDWESYKSFLNQDTNIITIKTLTKHNVFAISESTGQIFYKWSVYRCIYCELISNDINYVLNNGKWYQIDNDFLKSLDNYLAKIPESNLPLPPYTVASEAEYNQYVCSLNSNSFFLMDKQLISHGGGYSKIEYCDIYTQDRRLIHIKRDSGSSALSHLFAQGKISAELLLFDVAFREKINSILPASHKLENITQNPNAQDFEVIFAIASHNKNHSKELPLFSKINLRNTYKNFQKYGMKASLKFIETSSKTANNEIA